MPQDTQNHWKGRSMKAGIFAMMLAGAVALSPEAKAQDTAALVGHAETECRKVLDYFDADHSTSLLIFSWLPGYVSGMNTNSIAHTPAAMEAAE